MPTPFISVIIVAYQRRRYFWNAIESVLNQSLNKSLYEIIVITNFEIEMKNELGKNIKFIVTGRKYISMEES